MRYTNDGKDLICLFIDDLPDGSLLLQTPDGEINSRDVSNDKPFYLKDGREIFWPTWVDW